MIQKMKIQGVLGVAMLWLVCSAAVSARTVTVKLRGVYESKITLTPFNGMQFALPLHTVPGVKTGETTRFAIPDSLLPGEFQIHFDYRAKETDNIAPAEMQLYISRQDIGVDANPLHLQGDSLRLPTDRENTAWAAFAAPRAGCRPAGAAG